MPLAAWRGRGGWRRAGPDAAGGALHRAVWLALATGHYLSAWPAPATALPASARISFLPADHVPDASIRTGNVGLGIPRVPAGSHGDSERPIIHAVHEFDSQSRAGGVFATSSVLRWHPYTTCIEPQQLAFCAARAHGCSCRSGLGLVFCIRAHSREANNGPRGSAPLRYRFCNRKPCAGGSQIKISRDSPAATEYRAATRDAVDAQVTKKHHVDPRGY